MRIRDRPQSRGGLSGYVRVYFGPIGLVFHRPNRWRPWRLLAWAHFGKGPIRCMAELMEVARNMAKKPEVAAAQAGGAAAAGGVTALAKFPLLKGMLTDLYYEGTSDRRKPSSITIRADGGMWHCTLREPSSGLMLRIATDAYDDILPGLEALLSSKVVPWEPDPYARQEAPRRGRRGA